jgi:enamine deaminase RidA (YjgF/YER057c/UK114 family)
MTITHFDTNARLSQAIVYNNTVYLAGQVSDAPGGAGPQMEAIVAQIDTLLARAASNKSRLLNAILWLTDLADFPAVNAVWERWLGACEAPTRATAEVKLTAPEYKVEVIVTAATF